MTGPKRKVTSLPTFPFFRVIPWVVPPPRMPVTTRIITFLVGDPELNLHLPQLLGGGTTQVIPVSFRQGKTWPLPVGAGVKESILAL